MSICLKEAFQYQNHLTNLISECKTVLNSTYTTKITETHLRSKAYSEAQDEVIDKSAQLRNYNYTADGLIRFLLTVTEEKERLTLAISKAKRSSELDIDSELANNKTRRTVAATLSRVANVSVGSRIKTGMAQKFNAEGNPVNYTYEIHELTEHDFDRAYLKSAIRLLNDQADKLSYEVDLAMVKTEVDFTPLFNMNDSFEDSVEQITAAHAE